LKKIIGTILAVLVRPTRVVAYAGNIPVVGEAVRNIAAIIAARICPAVEPG